MHTATPKKERGRSPLAAGSRRGRVARRRWQDIRRGLEEARDAALRGKPVLVNALIGKTDFREGSLSV